MKVKTAKLEGPALDWAVCLALGRTDMRIDPDDGEMMAQDDFGYSTHWNQGGPIIEQERIAVWTPMTQFKKSEWEAGKAYIEDGVELEIEQEFYGPTPLIAAMRCFVTSRLGDEIEVPDELMACSNREADASQDQADVLRPRSRA
jgi:hypothetical protein